MARRRKDFVQPIAESVLERVAYIMGPFSAARQALDDAKRRRDRGEEPHFYTNGRTYFVGPKIESPKRNV